MSRDALEWPGGDAFMAKSAQCEWFQWIGQPWTSCDRCGLPAWEHKGEDLTAYRTGVRTRRWASGEMDSLRQSLSNPAAAVERARSTAAHLESLIASALLLHHVTGQSDDHLTSSLFVCAEDGQLWPCATVRTLDHALHEDSKGDL